MRTNLLKTILVLLLAPFLFSGCDLFEQVDDVTFDIELKYTFTIDASEQDPLDYVDFGEFDATQDSNFDLYKDKIKDFKITAVEYTVTDYQAEGDVIFSNGLGIFRTDGEPSAAALASATIDIQSISGAQGTIHNLDYTVAGLDAIAHQLRTVNKIYFFVEGHISDVPVSFKVPVTIKATLTADALE